MIRTSVERRCRGASSDVREQVVGQRPRRHDALLREGDGGGLGGTDPDRQVALAVASRSSTIGWLDGISTRTPTTSTSRTPPPYPARRAPSVGRRRSAPGAQTGLDQRRVQPHATAPRARGSASSARRRGARRRCRAQRRDDLLDQADLAVGGGAGRRRRWRGSMPYAASSPAVVRDDQRVARRSGRRRSRPRPGRSVSSSVERGRRRARPASSSSSRGQPQLGASRGERLGGRAAVGGQRDRRHRRTARRRPAAGGSRPRSIASRCSRITLSGR